MPYGLRGVYTVWSCAVSHDLDVSHAGRSNSTSLPLSPYHPQNWLLFSHRWVGRPRRTKVAVAALPVAKVRVGLYWILPLAWAYVSSGYLYRFSPTPRRSKCGAQWSRAENPDMVYRYRLASAEWSISRPARNDG